MKAAQPELLMNLDEKLNRVLAHWRQVNEALPPTEPLVLQDGLDRAAFAALVLEVSALRDAELDRRQTVTLARAAYERRKAAVHDWVRSIFQWMRAWMEGTEVMSLVVRVPGRGESYQHWWNVAHAALGLWRRLEAAPPPVAGWPMDFRPDCTLEHFKEAVEEFESAWWAILVAEVDLKIDRAVRNQALLRLTELLMAYTHCVRGRFPAESLMVESLPRLWRKRIRTAPPVPAAAAV